jgi:sugar phosphate isomerase/epimerase
MREMRKFMRVGLIHFMAYPATIKGEGPILETLKTIAADDYFDVVEVSWIKDDQVRAEARAMLETAHMTIAYGAQPRLLTQGLNLNHLDPTERRKAIDTVKEGINEAMELGAVGCAFLSGPYEPGGEEKALAVLVDSTVELCSYAKSKGDLKIVHEIFDYDVDKKSLVGPAPLARRYAELVTAQCDNFGLMADLSHIPLIHENYRQALEPIKDYLVHAHMGNCVVADPSAPGYGDLHPRFGFPGGENDVDELAEYLKVLLDIGFLNEQNPPIVSFEVKPFGDEEAELVIANAKRTLNRAWAKLD